MMEILKKFRAVVFAVIALFLYLFGYRQAKETAEKEQLDKLIIFCPQSDHALFLHRIFLFHSLHRGFAGKTKPGLSLA